VTLFLSGVFLLIAAFTVGYLWRNYRHLLAGRWRIEIVHPSRVGFCPECASQFAFHRGQGAAALLYHRETRCPARQVQP